VVGRENKFKAGQLLRFSSKKHDIFYVVVLEIYSLPGIVFYNCLTENSDMKLIIEECLTNARSR
jgi:hypothetical protein